MTRPEIKKLDDIARDLCKKDRICEKCGALNKQLHWHHHIGRRNRATRWYFPNLFCLCAGCHKLNIDSAHEHPENFRQWALRKRGGVWLKYLTKQSNKICKSTYQQVLDYLNGESDNYC